MDINRILNSYAGNIFTGNSINSARKDVKNEDNNITAMKTDFYKPEARGAFMSSECYDYSKIISMREKRAGSISGSEENFTTGIAESEEKVEGADGGNSGGGSGEKSEAKVETEVKIINGQAYMIITTTEEDGTTTVRNVKLGGRVQTDKKVTNQNDMTSLADAVTM